MARRLALADLPDTLPVFPLPGAILLPRARLPLNIFEPAYVAMLEDVLKSGHRLIGMVQPSNGAGAAPALYPIGCAGRVTSLCETEDGRYLIALTGIARFRIRSELESFAPYRRVMVTWAPFAHDLEPPGRGAEEWPRTVCRSEFLSLLGQYFAALELDCDWGSLQEAEPELLVNALVMMCPFRNEEKQALLEASTLVERAEILASLMRFALAERGAGGGSEDHLQ